MISAIFDLQAALIFLSSFESIGFLVQKKMRKVDFQDSGHLGFRIGKIKLYFIYKSPDASHQVSSQLA